MLDSLTEIAVPALAEREVIAADDAVLVSHACGISPGAVSVSVGSERIVHEIALSREQCAPLDRVVVRESPSISE